MLKIMFSSVGEKERVRDSVQPVHSWKDSQITDGRLALTSASAIAVAVPGGSAIRDAIAVQNFRNARRLMPCCARRSPFSVSFWPANYNIRAFLDESGFLDLSFVHPHLVEFWHRSPANPA